MGCGSSRSLPTAPMLPPAAPHHAVVCDDWMVCQPERQNCSLCGKSQTLPLCVQYFTSSYASSHTPSNTWPCYSTNGTDCEYESSLSPLGLPRLDDDPYFLISNHTFLSQSADKNRESDFLDIDQTPSPGTTSPYQSSRSYSLLSTPVSDSPSPRPRNNLTLDPALFSTATRGLAFTKMDTDCASKFSGTSLSPIYTSDDRYPLTPLSVRTEPFPRE